MLLSNINNINDSELVINISTIIKNCSIEFEYHPMILSNNIMDYVFKWIDIPNTQIQIECLSILKYLLSNSILLVFIFTLYIENNQIKFDDFDNIVKIMNCLKQNTNTEIQCLACTILYNCINNGEMSEDIIVENSPVSTLIQCLENDNIGVKVSNSKLLINLSIKCIYFIFISFYY